MDNLNNYETPEDILSGLQYADITQYKEGVILSNSFWDDPKNYAFEIQGPPEDMKTPESPEIDFITSDGLPNTVTFLDADGKIKNSSLENIPLTRDKIKKIFYPFQAAHSQIAGHKDMEKINRKVDTIQNEIENAVSVDAKNIQVEQTKKLSEKILVKIREIHLKSAELVKESKRVQTNIIRQVQKEILSELKDDIPALVYALKLDIGIFAYRQYIALKPIKDFYNNPPEDKPTAKAIYAQDMYRKYMFSNAKKKLLREPLEPYGGIYIYTNYIKDVDKAAWQELKDYATTVLKWATSTTRKQDKHRRVWENVISESLSQFGEKLSESLPSLKNFDFFPSTTIFRSFEKLIASGKNLNNLKRNQQLVSHRDNMQIRTNKERTAAQVIQVNESKGYATYTRIDTKQLDRLTASNGLAAKLLILILSKLNSQYDSTSKKIIDYEIKISLEEAAALQPWNKSRKIYESTTNAIIALADTKIMAARERAVLDDKGNLILPRGVEMLTLGTSIGVWSDGYITIKLNKDFNWNDIQKRYTSIPRYAYGLRPRSFRLMTGIAHQLRGNSDRRPITENGCIYLSGRNLSLLMDLPNEKTSTRPSRDIKGEIEKAVEEIETADAGHYLQFEFDYSNTRTGDRTAQIADYLDNMRLKVIPRGGYKDIFTHIENNINDKRTKRNKSIEKAKQKALETHISNRLEREQGPHDETV